MEYTITYRRVTTICPDDPETTMTVAELIEHAEDALHDESALWSVTINDDERAFCLQRDPARGLAVDTERLQDRVTAWHVRRFPDAQVEHVALKAAEEVGEVACAVNGVVGKNSATGQGDVPSEAADVVIALLVLLGRWFSEADLLAEVEKKLGVLTNPMSGHRAAAFGGGQSGE